MSMTDCTAICSTGKFFLQAYQNIYASQGNMTAGTDGKTIDAMSLERVDRLIAALKDESYQPKPSRRTYIPKRMETRLWHPSLTTSWYRKLSVCCWNPSMKTALRTPPRLRPNKSCHTALRMIRKSLYTVQMVCGGRH